MSISEVSRAVKVQMLIWVHTPYNIARIDPLPPLLPWRCMKQIPTKRWLIPPI